MYIKSAIIDSHSVIHHSFTDDFQLHMSAPPDAISELLNSMLSCINDVKAWATANMLRPNDNKTGGDNDPEPSRGDPRGDAAFGRKSLNPAQHTQLALLEAHNPPFR